MTNVSWLIKKKTGHPSNGNRPAKPDSGFIFGILESQVSSVIYFRHNDMQDCVIKLGKWYRTVRELSAHSFNFNEPSQIMYPSQGGCFLLKSVGFHLRIQGYTEIDRTLLVWAAV